MTKHNPAEDLAYASPFLVLSIIYFDDKILDMKKYFLAGIIILILGGGAWYYRHQHSDAIKIDLPPAQDFENFITDKVATDTSEQIVDKPKVSINLNTNTDTTTKPRAIAATSSPSIADKINLNIPFTSQAPTANWSEPFQDACEEASILMVDYYYQNKKFPDKSEVEKILLDMVKWQTDTWGWHKNLPVAKVAELATGYFGKYRPVIVEDVTIAKIKGFLNQGLPVIVPADGKKLDNPNFRNGGPAYHMLVIKGYAGDKFITNDPGTRLGADFIYTQANLMDSIADWNENEASATGPKRILILYKN